MRYLFSLLLFCASALPARAQYKNANAAGEAPGPWIFGTIGVGKSADGKTPKTMALKGLAIKVGKGGKAAVAYDLDLCRMAGAWTGGKFTTPMNLMSRGEYPTSLGEVAFTNAALAGFQIASAPATLGTDWKDPRTEPYGPLPEVRYRGLYTHGERTVLKWEVHGVEVLEAPSFQQREGMAIFIRTFQVAPSAKDLLLPVSEVPEQAGNEMAGLKVERGSEGLVSATLSVHQDSASSRTLANLALAEPAGAYLVGGMGQDTLQIPAHDQVVQVTVFTALQPEGRAAFLSDSKAEEEAKGPGLAILRRCVREIEPLDFAALTSGGPAHWPETVETKGEISTSQDAYVVDTITLPDPNPWQAPLFLGGFDFFPDGRAAVCTFHGDVFIVSGLDGTLEHVTWKRFATGLYHALGLKVVNGEIYVTERNGITRLRDLNGDGEADFYEAFNWDVKVTPSFHEFVFDLQTDPFGNFFFAKAGPVKNGGRGFDQICEHHGTLMRVSPDGKKFDVYATGFRAPNGLGVGPEGQITTGDNEGTWTPVCRINWITQSGFYGCVPTAHWAQPPTDYQKPICWLPKRIDNSAGSQVWVTSDRWGPWKGQMLHLSYGTCTLYGVMMEQVHIPDAPECCEYVMQGGVTAFPLKFQSGIMRARFSPKDGQLYVAGLRGWQTTGLKNGALQRVRYTGAPVRMPIGLAARKGGVEVKFTSSLDTKEATDPENWNAEVWNYIWSSAYGSPEISTLAPAIAPGDTGKEGEAQFSKAQMNKVQHDPLTIKSVSMGTDDRTVFLEMPDLKPVMQMDLKFTIKAADGTEMKGEVVNTIHGLGE